VVLGDVVNRQIRLAERPVGLPGPETWKHTTEPVGEPDEGQFLVRVSHLSIDPAMRAWSTTLGPTARR
jgi:NADPH-dependent curcumin reductase CurA